MTKEYERVNEPMEEKLERVAQSYAAGRISCPDPRYVAFSLRESTDRIRKMHSSGDGGGR